MRKYKERLVNKVLLLGKTKGLGYDISSIEAEMNLKFPEFARYIEVKSTKRVTTPSLAQLKIGLIGKSNVKGMDSCGSV